MEKYSVEVEFKEFTIQYLPKVRAYRAGEPLARTWRN
jgi:hypothetical protein